MNLNTVPEKLLKIAQTLEAKAYYSAAAKVKELAAAVSKQLPLFQSDENEKNRIVAFLKRIPGVKRVSGIVNRAQNIAYYKVETEAGSFINISQSLISPVKTISKQEIKYPFILSITDESGKSLKPGSGKETDEKGLMETVQRIITRDPKIMTELSRALYTGS